MTTLIEPALKAPVRERVDFGARDLDRIDPDWFNKINLDSLNLADFSECIMGQLLGDFEDCIYSPPYNWSPEDTVRRGLYVSGPGHAEALEEAYSQLHELWTKEICRRRLAAEESAT